YVRSSNSPSRPSSTARPPARVSPAETCSAADDAERDPLGCRRVPDPIGCSGDQSVVARLELPVQAPREHELIQPRMRSTGHESSDSAKPAARADDLDSDRRVL